MPTTAVFDAKATDNTKVSQLTAPTFTANIWKSSWVDVRAFRRLTGILAMNQASAANGVLIEQSLSASPTADSDAHYYSDTSTTLMTNPVTAQAYHTASWSIERVGLYARLVVKHGGVEPTTFQTKLIGAGIT